MSDTLLTYLRNIIDDVIYSQMPQYYIEIVSRVPIDNGTGSQLVLNVGRLKSLAELEAEAAAERAKSERARKEAEGNTHIKLVTYDYGKYVK